MEISGRALTDWYYVAPGSLCGSNVLNSAFPPQRLRPDPRPEHQDPVSHTAELALAELCSAWKCTTTLGEHTACLRQLQCHAGLCHCRLTVHSNYNYCTPPNPWGEWARAPYSATALTPSYLGGNRSLRSTYTQRWGQNQSWTPGTVRTKKRKGSFSQQPQEQRIKSPQSTRGRASVEYLNRQWINPKLRQWTLGATVDLGFAVYDWLASDFYVYLSIVFSTSYHWQICLLVWLLSFFLLLLFYFNNFFNFSFFNFFSVWLCNWCTQDSWWPQQQC